MDMDNQMGLYPFNPNIKWTGLRLIQIKWVMGRFMDMDKNCHPYPLPYHSIVATLQWNFQCHTYKVNIYSNPDAHQKPNINRESKILNQKSNKKAKDTVQYWFSLLSTMIAKLLPIKKNHPNIQTKTKAKQKQIITKIPLSKPYLTQMPQSKPYNQQNKK